MRHFHVAYSWTKQDGVMAGFGNVQFTCRSFPSRKELCSHIVENFKVLGVKAEDIVIFTILELSESDYRAWTVDDNKT